MYTGVNTIYGSRVLSNEYVQGLRDEDMRHPNEHKIIAQRGGQERGLSSRADITIYGGARGGAKSFSLLLEALKDVDKKGFKALIMRNEIDDLTDLIDTSGGIFSEFGVYNRSKNDMTWNFFRGGTLKFSYHADYFDEFKVRFQGKQYSYIGIDEITHMDYEKFKYIITCNRNASHIRNRVIGTCNPDKYSWVKPFIQWWLCDDPDSEDFGLPMPERDGVLRYCFMDGDNVNSIVWGDSKDEVYRKCKSTIDRYWSEEYRQYGNPEDLFVKSVTFISAKLADNAQLMRSDPTYLANLINQSEEARARDLGACWEYDSVGTDLIKQENMDAFYRTPYKTGDGIRRVSCDVAFEGGDSLVMWLWIGDHIADVFVSKMNSRESVKVVKGKLLDWHVREENFTYDLNGVGQAFKGFFEKAVPFNNREAVDPKYKHIYANMKSMAAYKFADRLKNCEMSIERSLLDRRFSGKGFTESTLREILNTERKAIKQSGGDSPDGWTLIKKSEMKKLVGHSPDFIEGLLMHEIFGIKHTQRTRPRHLLSYVNNRRYV